MTRSSAVDEKAKRLMYCGNHAEHIFQMCKFQISKYWGGMFPSNGEYMVNIGG